VRNIFYVYHIITTFFSPSQKEQKYDTTFLHHESYIALFVYNKSALLTVKHEEKQRMYAAWRSTRLQQQQHEKPCSMKKLAILIDYFYTATTIVLGNGRKTPFGEAPWLDGRIPKDIAPKIYECCASKNWTVSQALHEDAWIRKLKLDEAFSSEHITKLVELWSLVNNVQLQDEVDDDILWKFTNNGHYSAASAYKMQFLGLV
jgi:hypothetical protein